MVRKLRDPQTRFWGAIILFFITILAGLHSIIFVAQSLYDKILIGISWGAISLTAVDIIATTDVRKEEEKK